MGVAGAGGICAPETECASMGWSAHPRPHVPPCFERMWTWRFRVVFSGAGRESRPRMGLGGAQEGDGRLGGLGGGGWASRAALLRRRIALTSVKQRRSGRRPWAEVVK